MNSSDALFWLLDTVPELRSTIGIVMILEHAPDPQRLQADFLRLMAGLPRMRQRVIEVPFNLAAPEWVDDRQFDLDYHLRSIAVPAPGGMDELLAELGPFYACPLDRKRPLWEAYVAEGLLGGRAAVFLKMHHCLMDGVGGSQLLASLLGEHDGFRAAPLPVSTSKRSTTASARVWRAARDNLGEALAAEAAGVRALGTAVAHPVDTIQALAAGWRSARGFGRELAVPRADSPLHHRRSLSRRLATFDMALAEIDAARAVLGATNNDIILTIVSGALHRWHTSRGADVKELRALVPVSVRSSDDAAAGNRIALLAMGLPVGEPNPIRRLRLIQERMGRVKKDRRATVYPWLARALMLLPFAVATEMGRQQTRRTNLVCTNVPGPRHTCYLAGEAIEQMYPYGPLVGDHPVAIALYSYRDTVYVGLDVDPLAMDDLEHFRDALRESYAEVVNIACVADPAA
ncbi:MAG TPA: wax ester/triacylglycerol synthase family O-acyltransferase [Candidatus Binatia bacterium]|jgi:WS/DGAT/MGAT family acyltransferase